jgi:carbon-monoxide dehydrogenase medium subunit
MVALELDADHRIRRCAISLLRLGATPLRATAAENALQGQPATVSPDEVGGLAVSDASEAPSDLHGSAEYRTRVGAAMVARAWVEAIGEATAGDALVASSSHGPGGNP